MSTISEIFSGPYTIGKVVSIIVILPWYIIFATLDVIGQVLFTVFEPIMKVIFISVFFMIVATFGWGLLWTVFNTIYYSIV